LYLERSCWSSPTGRSTVKKRFCVCSNFHPSYIIQIFVCPADLFVVGPVSVIAKHLHFLCGLINYLRVCVSLIHIC
jgi:hypothetical protein